MPLLDRDTLVDRPVLVNRGDEEEEQDNEDDEGTTVETLGQGGGPVLHQLEFEPGDYNVVAGANTAAVLATGEQGGEAFEEVFVNAALQLKDLQEQGEDIRDIARFGLQNGVSELGLSMEHINILRQAPEEQEPEPEDTTPEPEPESTEEQSDDEEEQDADDSEDSEDEEDDEQTELEEVEDDIEEVKEDTDG